MSRRKKNRKYRLLRNQSKVVSVNNEEIVLYRIQALRDFADVKEGDVGGFVEYMDNLSELGNCWIYNDACVYNYARVIDNARIHKNVYITGNVLVKDSAIVERNIDFNDVGLTYLDTVIFDGDITW